MNLMGLAGSVKNMYRIFFCSVACIVLMGASRAATAAAEPDFTSGASHDTSGRDTSGLVVGEAVGEAETILLD